MISEKQRLSQKNWIYRFVSTGSTLSAMNAESVAEMTEAVELADGGVSVIDMLVNIVSEDIVTPLLSDYLTCIDRDACLKLFEEYNKLEHTIY